MKKFIPIIFLALAACSGRPPAHLPTAPEAPKQVLVCNAEVTRNQLDIDKTRTGLPLEQQNAVLRTSLAQLKTYVIELEASLTQCGGKVKK